MSQPRRRDIFLKIEAVKDYSPYAPLLCARHYGRDCMFNAGHESGRLSAQEILGAGLDALVFREYLDPGYSIPNTAKLIRADANEPPWYRRVPGAVLYAKPGERLYIHVLNGDPDDCHSFHLHGLRYGSDSDGAWPFGVASRDGRRSDEIRPGAQWTYVFDGTPETIGAWAFHDHVRNVQRNVSRGLFGGLIVRDPQAPCADHEVPLFVHQMQGATPGCQFQSPTLGPSQSFSFTFAAEVMCRYHCLIHGTIMSGEVHVEQGASTVARQVSMHDNTFDPAVVTVGPGTVVEWTNDEPVDPNASPRNHIVFAAGGGNATFCLNGRAYVGNTPTIEVEAGESLRWYLFNLDLSGVWHNFHPHSSRWQFPAPPHAASDVHTLSPAETFILDTEAPPALRLPCALEQFQCEPAPDACRVCLKGDYLFHCHLEEHMMQGLAGLIRSRQYFWINEQIARQLPVQLPYDDGANDCGHVDVNRCHQRTHSPHIAQATTKGLWELPPCDSQVLAVHAALLHTGKVLFFSGSGNDPNKLAAGDFRSVVWDYENGAFHRPATPADFFCAGHAFLPDGRLLVAGGTKQYDTPFEGLRDAYLFDSILEEWIRVQDMADGRWYPTLVTRGDGSILAVSGLTQTGPDNRVSEIYANQAGWQALPAFERDFPLYPHLFLLGDGKVFFSGGSMGGNAGLDPVILNIPGNTIAAHVPGLPDPDKRDQSASVMLPPAQDQHVMIMGGGVLTNTTAIADLSAGAAAYAPAAPLHFARMHLNAVILPDRTVFVSGGGSQPEGSPVLDSEIYDPRTNTWTLGAKATVPRFYHSVALLLPDGRVITAGSNPARTDDELRLELYHPPYLFKGPRPFIEKAPSEARYGEVIEIETPQAGDIQWVQIIRPMATTHSCDSEQRLVDMPFERVRFCRLHACLPREANLAPPGWYMVSITDRHGVPSVAKWVHLSMNPRLRRITKFKIFSPIGIARVGNSPEEFFVGPERVGETISPPGGFKDVQGRMKRQAARFRIFGYDAQGNLVQEVTSKDADIHWAVHLANKKAAWKRFEGLDPNAPLRNAKVKDRKSLIIEPRPRSLNGPNQIAHFDTGQFLGKKVPLGEIRTDAEGRLLVLGGFGHSFSPTGATIHTFANNDGWHDDVSDGPVTATVRLNGAVAPVIADPAWVIVGPPDFAAGIDASTTLYDTLLQNAVDKLGLKLPAQPSFTNDIYPLLKRTLLLRWVSTTAGSHHDVLASVVPPPGLDAVRTAIFQRLRSPYDGSGGDMPMIWSDTEEQNEALTKVQYDMMRKWSDGDFINDWKGAPAPTGITPEGMTRAALEACVGGALFPGIECGWLLRDVYPFSEPFRLDHANLEAGDITKQMSVPWQADFFACQVAEDFAWWPSQRPDDVFPDAGGPQSLWTRDLVKDGADMVEHWHQLGVVVPRGDRYVETERNK